MNSTLPSGLRAPSSSARDAAGAPGLLAAVLAVIAAGLLLCIVAAANGHPLIWGDTRAYFMAGRTAVERGLAILAALLSDPAAGGAPADSGATAAADGFRDVAAVRSAYYGALIYLPAAALRSFWPAILAQGLAVAWVVFVFCRVTLGERRRAVLLPVYLAAMLGLTLLTGLPWYAGQLMPDVFTGVTLLCVALLAFYRDRTTRLETWALAALLFASLTFHHVHLHLTVGLTVVALVLKWLDGRPLRDLAATAALLAVLTAAAVAAHLAVSYVGFRELSLTPQRPPILLSRVIADGPGRAYLEENCDGPGGPGPDYVLCELLPGLPPDALDILWAPDGMYLSRPTEVRERVRAEEMALVAAAAREYPLWQALASLGNWLEQLGQFGVADVNLDGRPDPADADSLGVPWSPAPATDPLLWWVSVAHYLVAGLGLLAIAASARRLAGDPRLRTAVAVVAAGIVLNAFLCGVLAEPMHRFGARVMWLVPLLAVPLLARRRLPRGAPLLGGGEEAARADRSG